MSTPRSRTRASTKSERKVAADLGGRRVFNSGTGLDKGDGRVMGKFRIENKYTESQFYTLTVVDWMTLWSTAIESLEQPVFHIKLLNQHGIFEEIVLIDHNFYNEMIGRQGELTFPFGDGPAKSVRLRAAAARAEGEPWGVRLDGKPRGVVKPRTWWLVVLPYARFLSLTRRHDANHLDR